MFQNISMKSLTRRFTTNSSQFHLLQQFALNILNQKSEILSWVSNEQYVMTHQSMQATIGGHLRHSLDHYQILLSGIEKETIIDYDERKRYGEVETNRDHAHRVTNDLRTKLMTLTNDQINKSIKVSFIANPPTGEKILIPSTIERELAFVSHHSIHHLATIRLMLEQLEINNLGDIGIANSTIKFRNDKKNM